MEQGSATHNGVSVASDSASVYRPSPHYHPHYSYTAYTVGPATALRCGLVGRCAVVGASKIVRLGATSSQGRRVGGHTARIPLHYRNYQNNYKYAVNSRHPCQPSMRGTGAGRIVGVWSLWEQHTLHTWGFVHSWFVQIGGAWPVGVAVSVGTLARNALIGEEVDPPPGGRLPRAARQLTASALESSGRGSPPVCWRHTPFALDSSDYPLRDLMCDLGRNR
jgi:hypothetical protein